MAYKNSPLFKPAMAIAVRTFFANANDNEQEIYDTLEECSTDPYQTYADDCLHARHPLKGYVAWQPFSQESVAGIMEIVDNLIDDIILTIENHINPKPEPSEDDTENPDEDDV